MLGPSWLLQLNAERQVVRPRPSWLFPAESADSLHVPDSILHVPTPHMRMSIELHGCLTVAGPDASQAVELPCPGVKSPRPRPLWIPVVRARIGGEQIGRLLLSSDRRPRRDRLGHS